MSNFILGTLESLLGLSDEEKATIEPCLPFAKDMIDRINDVWPQVEEGANVIEANKALISRMLGDIEVLLPNASALLGEGMYIDCGGSLSKIRDLQDAVHGNPKTVANVMALYTAIEPVIVQIANEWPKVAPAYNVIIAAAARKGYSLGTFLGGLHRTFLDTPKIRTAALKPASTALSVEGPTTADPDLKTK